MPDDATLNLKAYVLSLLEDPRSWSEFTASLGAAQEALAKFSIKLTDDGARALILTLWQIRLKLSEVNYELVNAVVAGDILINSPGVVSPEATRKAELAGQIPHAVNQDRVIQKVIGDGPKNPAFPTFNFPVIVPSYLVNAASNLLQL